MKSPSTLIALHEKCIKIQEMIQTCEDRINGHERSAMFHRSMYNLDHAQWQTSRMEINKAILERLKLYYTNTFVRLVI